MVFKRDDNGGIILTPRGAQGFVASIIVAVILGVINAIGLLKVDDSERYKSIDALADKAVVNNRLGVLEARQKDHESEPWHGLVGVQLGELREKLEGLRREQDYRHNIGEHGVP